MTAARAAYELRQGTGVTWSQETDRRLKQALGLRQSDATSTTGLWDLYLRKKGYTVGSYASRMQRWLASQGDPSLVEAYGAMRLIPYAGGNGA